MRKATEKEANNVHVIYWDDRWKAEWFETLKQAKKYVKQKQQIPRLHNRIFRFMRVFAYSEPKDG